MTSPGGQFTTKPLLRSPQGEAKVRVVPRGSQTNTFRPNTETFSAVHNISVVCLTRLARSPGGLGGRSRIEFIVSPLPRRRHNESHFAAQSPERAFLRRFRVSGFCLRSFARAKNGVNLRRRSRKISVGKAKSDSKPHPMGSQIWHSFPRDKQGTTNEKMCDTMILPAGKALFCAAY